VPDSHRPAVCPNQPDPHGGAIPHELRHLPREHLTTGTSGLHHQDHKSRRDADRAAAFPATTPLQVDQCVALSGDHHRL
jgi:hypothetical protein